MNIYVKTKQNKKNSGASDNLNSRIKQRQEPAFATATVQVHHPPFGCFISLWLKTNVSSVILGFFCSCDVFLKGLGSREKLVLAIKRLVWFLCRCLKRD